MTATFHTNQPTAGKTTVRFQWSADSAKLQTIMNNYALHLHSRGIGPTQTHPQTGAVTLVPFADLTNQQKLNIVDGYLMEMIKRDARKHRLDAEMATAVAGVSLAPEPDEFDI